MAQVQRVQRLNRKVLLGVCGGIAAYKTPYLVRELVKAGAEVQVVMTRAAHDFVTPLALATVSGRPVLTDLFVRDGSGQWNDHVHLARWADVMLIAPATVNTIARMAQGISDDLLMACYLSLSSGRNGRVTPVHIAPAMDLEMYHSAANQTNLIRLRERGVRTIGPDAGELASGLVGEGRMTAPDEILKHLIGELLNVSNLNGVRVLITAGGTQEPIDPVRYIGNRSSGKMGFALATEAAARGAEVVLVAGPVALKVDQPGISRIDVTTAAEMATVCHEHASRSQVIIMCAAVADFRPKTTAAQKIKKHAGPPSIELERTEDILDSLGKAKKPGQTLVGFALETTNALTNAQEKLSRKNADLLVLNSMQDAGAGFGHDTNVVTILAPDKDPQQLPLMPKNEVARAILDRIEELCRP